MGLILNLQEYEKLECLGHNIFVALPMKGYALFKKPGQEIEVMEIDNGRYYLTENQLTVLNKPFDEKKAYFWEEGFYADKQKQNKNEVIVSKQHREIFVGKNKNIYLEVNRFPDGRITVDRNCTWWFNPECTIEELHWEYLPLLSLQVSPGIEFLEVCEQVEKLFTDKEIYQIDISSLATRFSSGKCFVTVEYDYRLRRTKLVYHITDDVLLSKFTDIIHSIDFVGSIRTVKVDNLPLGVALRKYKCVI